MAKKRFTDIEIWDKEWYMELKPKHKCLMKYIFDKCDASGCWKPNWKLASLHIGELIVATDLLELPKDQYEILENGKVFIPDFIPFQYGKLSEKSPAHNPIFLAMEKNNITNRVLDRLLNSLKEKDKEKEKEVDKEKERVQGKGKGFNTMPIHTDEVFETLPKDQIKSAIDIIGITQQVKVSEETIMSLWSVFKIQNLTGNKYYASIDKVYNYFNNWSKTQKLNGSESNNGSNKLGTSAARIKTARDW